MRFFLIPVLLFAAMPSVAQGADGASFRIDKVESGAECRIVAVNLSAAPVTVVPRDGGRKPGKARVVAPNSSLEIARVFAKKGRPSCWADISYTYSVGDALAVPDRNYRYRLPFGKGTAIRIVQEPNGVITTHKDDLSRYAVDFGVPRKTPVLAARAGTVIEVRDSFTEGRPDPALAEKTNLVSILHADGTFAQYAHLAPRGVLVCPGERVEAGQLIAYSGNTGFAGGPHLHFDLRRAAIRADGTVAQESLPVAFFNLGSGKKITLRQRRQMTVD